LRRARLLSRCYGGIVGSNSLLKRLAASDVAVTAGLLCVCTVYVWALWGPSPLAGEAAGPQLPLSGASVERRALLLTASSYVFGLVIPCVWIRLAHRRLADFGLTRPDQRGVRLGAIGALVCVPLGFWLSSVVEDPWGSPTYEALELVSMIPEHFLVFGVVVALSLRDRRLPGRPALARLSVREVGALILSMLTFVLIHIGGNPVVETLVVTPVGLLFAYVTLRSGSIWPAVIVHWLLNLVPMGWDAVGRAS
jgi:membrane protease YdiL (CAAX protease family)